MGKYLYGFAVGVFVVLYSLGIAESTGSLLKTLPVTVLGLAISFFCVSKLARQLLYIGIRHKMAYKFTNVKVADLEEIVRRVYNTFPNMVGETLLSAKWIIQETSQKYWEKFYAELTSGDADNKSGSETQKNFEKNLKKV